MDIITSFLLLIGAVLFIVYMIYSIRTMRTARLDLSEQHKIEDILEKRKWHWLDPEKRKAMLQDKRVPAYKRLLIADQIGTSYGLAQDAYEALPDDLQGLFYETPMTKDQFEQKQQGENLAEFYGKFGLAREAESNDSE